MATRERTKSPPISPAEAEPAAEFFTEQSIGRRRSGCRTPELLARGIIENAQRGRAVLCRRQLCWPWVANMAAALFLYAAA